MNNISAGLFPWPARPSLRRCPPGCSRIRTSRHSDYAMLMRFPGHWLPHIAGRALRGRTGETFLSTGGHNMAEARKVFEQEIANVEQQIRVLRQRREHLRALLGTYSQPPSSPAAAVASTA